MSYKIYRVLIVAFLLVICASPSVVAQKRQGIGISFGANDFYGPQTGKYFTDKVTTESYNQDSARYDTTSKKKFRWAPLVRVTYWYEINKFFDFNLGLAIGNTDYPASDKDSTFIQNRQTGITKYKRLLLEADARINFNILPKDKYIVSPYIFAGITGTHHPIYFGADVPLGLGLNFNLSKNHDIFLNLESAYKLAITNTDQTHLQHTAGFIYWFKPHYHPPTPAEQMAEVMPPSDVDHDGVPDSADKCPTVPGLAAFNGCPDSDGDGVPDNLDACPLVAGNAGFNGCPDTDGDGIPDNTDKCPYQAGLAQYNGCPPPDADHDGVIDSEDQCPNVAGTAENHGCPEIRKEVIEKVEKAARSVYFETGKSALKKVSYKSLNTIAQVMKDDPSLYVDIGGHTDNVGSDDRNMTLSDARANVCRDYLISQGISADRITAKGYGETQPIADNKTATGRAQNRRTEFKLSNYRK